MQAAFMIAAIEALSLHTGTAPIRVAQGHATLTAVADVSTAPSGEHYRVGVRFKLATGWHVYWKNPGQSGFATELAWRGAAAKIGDTRWPFPTRFASEDGFIVTYGYAADVLLWSEATQASGGRLEVVVDALVCKVDCIPVSETLALEIPLGPRVASAPALVAAFDAAAAAEPHPPSAVGLIVDAAVTPSPVRPGDEVTITLRAHCPTGVLCPSPRGADAATQAFVERVPGVTLAPRGWSRDGVGFVVTLTGNAGPDDPRADQTAPVVLVLDDGGAVVTDVHIPRAPLARSTDSGPSMATPGTVALPASSSPAGPPPIAPVLPLLGLLAVAFVGGLVLNLMPCVLPVLAIKVAGLGRLAGSSRASIALHGAAYAAGVLLAMLALGGLLLVLRATGTSVGWGFQFQEPLFPALVGALLVALALSAFGLFHVGVVGARVAAIVDARHGVRRSLGEGVLAVVLATPCSAPFLGGALGVALVSPAPVALATFAAIGLGLSAPMVMLALVPAAGRLVPRPGAWMVGVERVAGFALLAAAIWLAWIVGRAAGADAMARTLAFWLAVAAAAWLCAAAQRRDARARFLLTLAAAGLALALAGRLLLDFSENASGQDTRIDHGLAWEPWDDAVVARALAEGHPVFVNFTADWCLTCQANERLVITSDAVRAALARYRVVTLRADWTRRDERIRKALAAHGKAGVPMYLVYSPSRPDSPQVLPELLTQDLLIEALAAASPLSKRRTP